MSWGFSIVRVVNGVTQDVTKEMIVAARSGQSSGSSYQYQDVEEKQPGVYYYQLEIHMLDGSLQEHGIGVVIIEGARRVFMPLVTR
jgi:hypothetical protein